MLKSKKKLLAVILTIAMTIALTPTVAFSEDLIPSEGDIVSGFEAENVIADISEESLEIETRENADISGAGENEGDVLNFESAVLNADKYNNDPDPDPDPDPQTKFTFTAKSETVKYDGELHTLEGFTEPLEFVFNGQKYTIEGVTASVSSYNAGTYPTEIYNDDMVIKDSQGEPVLQPNFELEFVPGTLTIEKRNVVLRSVDLSKVYDGTALVNGDNPIKIEGDGFAPGEGVKSYTFTGSQTEVGSDPNSFEYELYPLVVVNSLSLNNNPILGNNPEEHVGTNPDNYDINKAEGTLTVTKRQVILRSVDLSKVYDGTALVNGDNPIKIEGDGFLPGEGVKSYTFTGSQTEVGSSPNSFEYELYPIIEINSLNLNDDQLVGTNPNNYDIARVFGTLTVTSTSNGGGDEPRKSGTPSDNNIQDDKPPLGDKPDDKPDDAKSDDTPDNEIIKDENVPTSIAPDVVKQPDTGNVTIFKEPVPKSAFTDNKPRLPQTGQSFLLIELLAAISFVTVALGLILNARARRRS
ncbi:MAG: hypothetical protein ACTTJ2_01245 [Anaerovoracaceae bacterium]